MSYNLGLNIGQILKNADIIEKFKCGNMGGMRRSKTTNTLVILSDYTKGLYILIHFGRYEEANEINPDAP